jgi:tetratricopeptide (TPR) repeat protein
MESGQTETARRLYLESWERYRSTQIKENGRAEKGIVWNTDDCQNLIRLGELELLNQAFRYVEGFMDVHPIDFWIELAQAWWDANDRSSARFLLRTFLNHSRDIDDRHIQARKYLLLAAKLRELGFPRRAQILVAAAQKNIDKIKARDQRFYLYEALIRYHLEHHEVHEAQVLCRQARLWMLGKKPTETSENLKGFLESGLISFYGKAGLTEELPELVESLKQIIGDKLNLALAEAWMHAAKLRNTPHAFAQTEQAIAAVPGAYWQFEMWMRLFKVEASDLQ